MGVSNGFLDANAIKLACVELGLMEVDQPIRVVADNDNIVKAIRGSSVSSRREYMGDIIRLRELYRGGILNIGFVHGSLNIGDPFTKKKNKAKTLSLLRRVLHFSFIPRALMPARWFV